MISAVRLHIQLFLQRRTKRWGESKRKVSTFTLYHLHFFLSFHARMSLIIFRDLWPGEEFHYKNASCAQTPNIPARLPKALYFQRSAHFSSAIISFAPYSRLQAYILESPEIKRKLPNRPPSQPPSTTLKTSSIFYMNRC